VLRVGVDSNDAGYHTLDPGFLERLADPSVSGSGETPGVTVTGGT
jgi:hypothetical protein